jgi:hypothetical protein
MASILVIIVAVTCLAENTWYTFWAKNELQGSLDKVANIKVPAPIKLMDLDLCSQWVPREKGSHEKTYIEDNRPAR